MRLQEFENWFGTIPNRYGKPFDEDNVAFYVNASRHAEQAEGVDLDKEFRKDKMASFYDYCKYSKQDKRDKLPNPTNMKLHREIYAALSDIRSALNHYIRFCKKHPPK